jgi:hypothetical protein
MTLRREGFREDSSEERRLFRGEKSSVERIGKKTGAPDGRILIN